VAGSRGEDPRHTLGRRVAQLRAGRGWRQEELARRSGLHRSYISSLENGERNVGLVNLHRLADALEVRVEELLATDLAAEGDG